MRRVGRKRIGFDRLASHRYGASMKTAPDAHSLDDEQLLRFLRDGYVVLRPGDLAPAFHAAMFQAACEVHDEAQAVGNSVHLQVIGDNLRARIPLVERLLNSATVRGALASVLGDGWLLHPHHFVHEASGNDQSFHQDGNLPWNDRAHYRTHRPNWAMLFYYPQAVTLASGPTEVLPGSQYWTTNFEKPDGAWHRGDAVDKNLHVGELNGAAPEARDRRLQAVVDSLGIPGVQRRKLELPAGSVVLAHYDLMHRGSRTDPAFDGRRFMFKFYYLRTRDPHPAPSAPMPAPSMATDDSPLVVQSVARWLRGDVSWQAPVVAADQIPRIEAASAEDERIRLAYEIGWLARQDAAVREELGRLLASDDEALRRSMAYAFGIAGAVAEPGVRAGMASEDPRVRRVAAYAAGEARLTSDAVHEALLRCLEGDADDLVRSNAAYALGNIARRRAIDVDRLLARLHPAVEADNTTNGGMRRSTVRVNVMYALCNAVLDDSQLDAIARTALIDHDRYVSGLAVALLERYAERHDAWLRRLVEHLAAARYNARPPPPQDAQGPAFKLSPRSAPTAPPA